VDDTVRDRLDVVAIDRRQRLDRRRRPVLGDQAQLQARRACVDD